MSSAEQGKESQDWTLRFLDEVERVGFADEEQKVVLAPLTLREVKVIEADGSKFLSPREWMTAIEDAHERERQFYRILHEAHGFPDTSTMEPAQGHYARLTHLMSKYPEANWDLLMQQQDTAMSRKPTPARPMKITVQVIERNQLIFLNLAADKKHLMNERRFEEVATVSRTMERKRRTLLDYGIDPDALLTEYADEVERMVVERANEVAVEDRQPLVLRGQGLFDASEEKPVPDASTSDEQGSEAADIAVPSLAPESVPVSVPEQPESVSGAAVIGVNEMAQRLGRSAGTVREYLQQNKIPGAIQTGGRWTVNRDAFEEWLKGKPAVIPSAREVRKAVQATTRPKWDNGDFRPSF